MAEYNLEELQEARDLAYTAYKAILADPKPDYEVDGQRFSWTQYTRMLLEQIEGLNKLIKMEDSDDLGFEVTIVG